MCVFGLSFGSSTLQHKKHQQLSSLPIDIGGARLDYAYQREPWNWQLNYTLTNCGKNYCTPLFETSSPPENIKNMVG